MIAVREGKIHGKKKSTENRVYSSSAALFQQAKTSQINLLINISFSYSLSD